MYQVTFPAQSRDASWAFIGQITDLDDNPIDLTGLALVFSIRDKRGNVRLTAQTADGSITVIDLGTFRWFFTLQQMQALTCQTYQTGFTAATADGTQTVQFFVGPLPIISGNMSNAGDGDDYDNEWYGR
jgi:hypothetical protein